MLALSDPARPDSAEIIAHIRSLGIRPLMLTGDNQAIAAEIACEVGIGKDIRRAGELRGLDERERLKAIGGCDGFAEVYPQDKYEIVKLLQDAGHMVGMTGDGVNDAPALKQAELGTAVSGATDVARASASVVLTRPGLSEIVDTVVASRQTYQRMLTWVINFATMTIATDNAVSTKSPNSWNIRSIISASAMLGILFGAEDLLVALWGRSSLGLPYEQLCTLILLSLVFNTQFRILMVRERRHLWASVPGTQMLVVSLITIVAFACLGVFGSLIPTLKISQVMCLLLIGVGSALVIDLAKCQLFKRFGL